MTHTPSWLFFFPFCVDLRRGRGKEAKCAKLMGKTEPRCAYLGLRVATVWRSWPVGERAEEPQVKGMACMAALRTKGVGHVRGTVRRPMWLK